MTQKITTITSDDRLDRLFGTADKPCAIQLWLLQIYQDAQIETRMLYGRITPSSYCNNTWNAPREDNFICINEVLQAQVIRLNVFCGSVSTKGMIESLANGSTLKEASKSVLIQLSHEMLSRFGATCLTSPLAFRPSMHLPTRDYFCLKFGRLSPTNTASADSASITSLKKTELFKIDNQNIPELADFALNKLNHDTGMDFLSLDAWRLGDIELIALPGLDDQERELVNVQSKQSGLEIQIFAPLAPPEFELQIRALFLNDKSVLHLDAAVLPSGTIFPTTVKLNVPSHQRHLLDAYEVEIDARNITTGGVRSCIRWGVNLIREIHHQMNVRGGVTNIENDWLSIAIRPKHQSRLSSVQQLARHASATNSVVGGRESDPWVLANRTMSNLAKQLIPPKSDARFFLRYSEGENTGRLELAEWLRKLFADNRDMNIAWFDPYMEDVGIHLLNQFGSENGHFLIFTTGSDQAEQAPRIKKLKAACLSWTDKIGSVKLRVVGLPDGDLHDRMILIRNAHMEPVAGFHLSNSIQHANENHPLLITPIPADVLQQVVAYADATIRKAFEYSSSGGAIPPDAVLFDSDRHKQVEKLLLVKTDICAMPLAVEVFAWWLDESEMCSLIPEQLKIQLETSGYLHEGNLRGSAFQEIPIRFWSPGFDPSNFNSAWDIMGSLLAHSHAGDSLQYKSTSITEKLSHSLYSYLDSNRSDALQPTPSRYGLISMTDQLARPLSVLLTQVADPDRMYSYGITEVSWGDYYAIKLLWHADPLTLVRWIEEGVSDSFRHSQRRQLGLKCAVQTICFEGMRSCSMTQLDALLGSSNDFLRWVGFVAFETLLGTDHHALTKVSSVSKFKPQAKLQFLGWLIKRANRRSDPVRDVLIPELTLLLPVNLTSDDLDALLDSLRNIFGKFYDNPPWILQDILLQLLHADRLDFDLVALAWWKEMSNVWIDVRRDGSLMFDLDSEGRFTDEVVNLIASAGHSTQKVLLTNLRKELTTCGRNIRLPFSSQIDWNANDKALSIAFWIAAILDGVLKHLPRPSRIELMLHELATEANNLSSRRRDHDWVREDLRELARYRRMIANNS